jgi:hypothetical protein
MIILVSTAQIKEWLSIMWFLFFFWPYHAACGILVPRPGNWVLSTGPLGKSYISVTSKTHFLPSPTLQLTLIKFVSPQLQISTGQGSPGFLWSDSNRESKLFKCQGTMWTSGPGCRCATVLGVEWRSRSSSSVKA